MTKARKTTLAILSIGSPLLAVACSAILGLEPPTPPADGGAEGGAACATRYVSVATGDDGNDGCSPDKPLQTIKAALAAAETNGTPGFVIKVCEGTYKEDSLQISLPGTLQGSWDCAFTRQVSANAVNGTTVEVANDAVVSVSSQRVETFRIAAKALAPGAAPVVATVDHFKFVGAGVKGSWAVHIATNQPTKLSSCVINGADTEGAAALYLTLAAAEVTENVILGGSAPGAYAVEIFGDPLLQPVGPHLHGNTITAGSAATGTGSGIGSVAIKIDGVSLTADAGAPLEQNVITTQSISGVADAGAAGVTITNAAVDVVGNVIRSNGAIADGESASQSSGVAGIQAFGGAAVRIVGNRIYSGGKPGFGDWTGVLLNTAKSAAVVNNVIYAGPNVPGPPQVLGSAIGVLVIGVSNAVIVSNTIFSGYPIGAGKRGQGINLSSQSLGAVIENNILAGAGVADWGIHVASLCPTGISVLRNNLFVGQTLGTLEDTACDAGPSAKDITSMSALVQAAGQNLALRDTLHCSGADLDAGNCVIDDRCGEAGPCLADLFAGWTGTDNGLGAWDGGWRLSPQVSCRIGLGGLDLKNDPNHPVPVDFFGTPRATPPTIGATDIGDGGCL